MLRVRTLFVGPSGTPWLNTMYFQHVTEDQAAANAAVAAVGAFWGAVDLRISTSVSWATEVDVVKMDVNGVQELSFAVTPATGTGAATGDMLPAVTQGLLRWRTGTFINGREVRGRTFIPGLSEAQATLGVMDSACAGTINTAAAALIADANSTLIIWSRLLTLSSTVSSGTAWNSFAVLRSRRD